VLGSPSSRSSCPGSCTSWGNWIQGAKLTCTHYSFGRRARPTWWASSTRPSGRSSGVPEGHLHISARGPGFSSRKTWGRSGSALDTAPIPSCSGRPRSLRRSASERLCPERGSASGFSRSSSPGFLIALAASAFR
jgi:hypothetical protein